MQAEPELGSTANSYAIVAKLATGGMAEIFLARTESAAGVERYVVLKRVLRHRATDIKFVHMFLDEARLAAQLQHPNIAQVYDTGKLGDSYFFTMEYVHGETVRELLHRAYALGQLIPVGCALTIVAGAAAGLQHAHERIGLDGKPLRIVHRDVSPSNLMISFEGNVKLVDFGVAKADHQSIETQSGTVKGKIGYMAPEQCRGGAIDARCDLFSLGIVMWELLTGERLFKRATDFEAMEAIVRGEVAPPSSRRPDLPPEIDAIVMKLLAKNPADRYQSAEELHEEIEVAAARAQLPLSLPALRRFVRELFGQRPEPWVEMRVREARPEIVTVTGMIVEPNVDAVDLQLGRVIDLSAPASESGPQVAPSPRAVSPLRAPTAPTVSGLDTAPARPSSGLSLPVVRPSGLSIPVVPLEAGGSPPRGLPDGFAPVGSELSVPAVGRLSGQEPAVSVASGTWTAVPPRRSKTLLAIVAFAMLGGIAIGAVVYATSRKAEIVAVTRPPEPPITPDAAEVTDTVATVQPDEPRPAPKPPVVDVEKLFADHAFSEVISECTNDATVLASHAPTCVEAACRKHDEAIARRWIVKVADKRTAIAHCREQGVALVKPQPSRPPAKPPSPKPPPKPPKPTKPNCADDPMACR